MDDMPRNRNPGTREHDGPDPDNSMSADEIMYTDPSRDIRVTVRDGVRR